MLLDLDELDYMHRKIKWFSVNSFNIFSFFDRDHGPGQDQPLRPWIETQLAAAGIKTGTGRIMALCLPRILGYAFNPLTVYFCYDEQQQLAGILYEVSNTFGERHSYLFKIGQSEAKGGSQNKINSMQDGSTLHRHSCEKRLYVSPFMNVEGNYHFRVKSPANDLFLHIHQTDREGPILDAWVRGKRASIQTSSLLSNLLRFPLLTLKVISGIHWEALQLWLKGVGLKKRPAAPSHPVTIIHNNLDH